MRQGRFLLAIILLLGGLSATSAIAQSAGSELVEPLSADSAGDEAFIALEGVEAFAPDGGEAVLEPGTSYEETLTYATVDEANNRLVGLTRSAPLAHSAGVFVQVPAPEAADPEPSPTPEETPSDPADHGEEELEESPADSAAAPPPVCEPVFDERSCGEVAGDVLGPIVGDPCEPAHIACQALDDLETGDPVDDLCDPAETGQTCDDWLAQFVGDPIGDLCDPEEVGQSCAEWLGDVLAPFIGLPEPGCDLVPYQPNSCIAVSETPDVVDVDIDPLGPSDDTRNDLLHGECYARSATWTDKASYSATGWVVRGAGDVFCLKDNGGPAFHDGISIEVCLKYRTVPGGAWKDGPCQVAGKPSSPDITENVEMACLEGTWKYRTRVEGWAFNAEGALIHNPVNRGFNDVERKTCHSSDALPPIPFPDPAGSD